jgi:hypothetical protein
MTISTAQFRALQAASDGLLMGAAPMGSRTVDYWIKDVTPISKGNVRAATVDALVGRGLAEAPIPRRGETITVEATELGEAELVAGAA